MRDPAAIILDPDQRDASVTDLHLYRGCSCVDGILHQLLYYRSRAFYDLACSDLIYCYLI